MIFNMIRLAGLTNVDLPIEGALPSDPLVLKAADGLGPPDMTVSISRNAQGVGTYHTRKSIGRQIVMRVGLNPDYSANERPADLRTTLYGLLSPGVSDEIPVYIMHNGTIQAKTTGVVSKIEPALFTKEPEVQITVDCVQTLLEHNVALTLNGNNWGFLKTGFEAENLGTAPTGFEFQIELTADASSFALIDAAGRKFQVDHAFLDGDILEFETRPGIRKVELTRAGITTDIIQSLTDDSSWLSMHSGENLFTTSQQNFEWGHIVYRPLYWGV